MREMSVKRYLQVRVTSQSGQQASIVRRLGLSELIRSSSHLGTDLFVNADTRWLNYDESRGTGRRTVRPVTLHASLSDLNMCTVRMCLQQTASYSQKRSY